MADKTIKRKHFLLFIVGGLSVVLFLALSNKVIKKTSTNEFCASCHAHPHAHSSFKLSVHNSNSSGVSTRCVACHLPPEDQPVYFLIRKAYHGFHVLSAFFTKHLAHIEWE